MDRQTLALFIPILALAIPVAAVIFSGINKNMRLRVEEAKARAGLNAETAAELDALAQEVQELRQELVEVSERMDFAERLLTRGERGEPPGSGQP